MKTIAPSLDEVTVVGTLTENFKYDHTAGNVQMFKSKISVQRASLTKDVIPLIVSLPVLKKFCQGNKDMMGVNVAVVGRLSSNNKPSEEDPNHKKLNIFIKTNSIQLVEKNVNHENHVVLSGYICKPVNIRKTLGIKDENGKYIKYPSKIADILLAVNVNFVICQNDKNGNIKKRPYKKTYYIPCIAWNKEADYASYLKVGDRITIDGRIQSREYYKNILPANNEDTPERKKNTVYEVSINVISRSVILEEENEELEMPEVTFTKDNNKEGFNI